MPFTVDEKIQDQIYTLTFSGSIEPADMQAFGIQVVETFRKGCSFLILDIDGIEVVSQQLIDYLYQLNDKLVANGASLACVRSKGDLPSYLEGTDNRTLTVEESRHVALGMMVSVMTVKKEIIEFLNCAESLTYYSQADSNQKSCEATFVRNVQNFLVIAPGEDFDTSLDKGYRLIFSVNIPADEENELPARIVRFDSLIEKFAAMKDLDTPALVMKCPTEYEVEEVRGEKELQQELKMNFWGVSGDRTPTAAMLTAVDTEQITFRVSRLKHPTGAELFVDIDFVAFKFSQPQRVRITAAEHAPMGEMLVTAEFTQLSGSDFGRIEDYLDKYC